MNYVSWHFGDYLKNSMDLDWEEDLALRRLIEQYYVRGLPLPSDIKAVWRFVRATTPKQKKATEMVLSRFFELTPEGWRNQRCELEISKYLEKSQKAKNSADERWKPKPTTSGESDTENTLRTHSEGNAPTPTPTPNPNPSKKEAAAEKDDFKAFANHLEDVSRNTAGSPLCVLPDISPMWKLSTEHLYDRPEILAAYDAIMAKPRREPIRSWVLIARMVKEALDVKAMADAPESAQVKNPDEWIERLQWARKEKKWWDGWGPAPRTKGCIIPLNYIRDEDGIGWGEHKP